MIGRISKVFLWLVILLAGVLSLGWSVLALPVFSDFRRAIVADGLTEQIGQPLLINGDVRVALGPVSRVHASGVEIPSETIDGVTLAELATLEFDVDLFAISRGRIRLNNLLVDGLKVELLTLEDGTQSWSAADDRPILRNSNEAGAPSEPDDPTRTRRENEGQGLLSFLRTRTASITNIRLIYNNDITGFEYDFELEKLALEQLDGGTTLGVTSFGTVNAQPFEIAGNYPAGAPFTTRARFSSVELSYDGEPTPADQGGGFSGLLTVDVTGLGDLLEVLKLNRTLEGTGRWQTTVATQSGVTSLSDISSALELGKGQLITVAGEVENITTLQGLDLQFDARLFPENSPPPKADDLKDIQLTGISTRLVKEEQGLQFDNLLVTTNAFQQGLDEVGPVSIGRIRRTGDGYLAFEDIVLQAGPRDAPVLAARGNIRNVLELKDLDLEGEIDAPASLVLGELGEEVADPFGGVEASFALNDAQGYLSLTRLTARAVDTDIWELDASMEVGEVTTLDGSALDLRLVVQDGADFLSALNLTPVEAGPLGVSVSIRGEDGFWTGDFGLGAGQSQVTATGGTGEANGRRTLNAEIVSEVLLISDLRNAIAGAIELGKIGTQEAATGTQSDVDLQPLVLPKQEPPAVEPETLSRDGIELQPLVLPKDEDDEIFDTDEFLRETDIYASIDFRKISGLQGVTRVSSDLVSEGGKARLGPLEFNYGSGYFNFQAAMDVVDAPDRLSVAGATSGWNLADVLREAGVDFDASGALVGRFNLSGNIRSLKAFANSVTGTAVVEMANGQMATSLLELAGLGVFPWLFSQERRQGYTDIVCINLPVRLTAGVVSFDPAVAETRSVQMVARGTVDLKNDTVALRAEPRPVGQPLARSAWPVNVSGPLSNPDFKLDVGGSRSRRADGADQMPENRKPCQPDIYQLQQRGG